MCLVRASHVQLNKWHSNSCRIIWLKWSDCGLAWWQMPCFRALGSTFPLQLLPSTEYMYKKYSFSFRSRAITCTICFQWSVAIYAHRCELLRRWNVVSYHQRFQSSVGFNNDQKIRHTVLSGVICYHCIFSCESDLILNFSVYLSVFPVL